MKRQQTIVYWAFNIDIVGPRHEELRERQRARKALSKRLRQIEQAALRAAEARLPQGFRVVLS